MKPNPEPWFSFELCYAIKYGSKNVNSHVTLLPYYYTVLGMCTALLSNAFFRNRNVSKCLMLIY